MASKKNVKKKIPQAFLGIKESKIMNEQQTVFHLVRKLVQAQLDNMDEESTKRIWQDVAKKGIDFDRVINLMYTCSIHEDDNEMLKIDEIYQRTGLVG